MGKSLKVQEAYPGDALKGIARLHPDDMAAIGVRQGDLIEITGGKGKPHTTAARVREGAPLGAIQADGLIRENAGAALDEAVQVERAAAHHFAGSVTLQPLSGPLSGQEEDGRHILSLLEGGVLRAGDRVRLNLLGTRVCDFLVSATTPEGTVIVSKSTYLNLLKPADVAQPHKVTYEDIGGLGSQIRKVRELIELPLRFPQVFERLGIQPPKGVLLYGPPGTGKTVIARAVANETDAWFSPISGPEVIGKFYGESEERLRALFEEAQARAPSILFFDEIDAIAPKREEMGGEKQVERRVVAQLLALMDGLESRGQVVVIGATNIPNSLDPALRRPGRFDREIAIPIPDRRGRREILEIHTRGMPLAKDVDLDRVAGASHGFVGADLEALAKEAAMSCVRDVLPHVDLQAQDIPYEKVAALEVGMRHFMAALAEIEPSAVREVFVEVPNVTWEDVAGLEAAKEELTRAVTWPLRHGELFERYQLQPPRSILLRGPSGTGKTLLAKALARESGVNFIPVQAASILSRYLGESERALRGAFRTARQAAPSILYFDRIEALLPRGATGTEARVLAQFLTEMGGLEGLGGVVVLAETGRPEALEPSLRFDKVLDLPLPDEAARRRIFQLELRGKPTAPDLDLGALAKGTEGASGGDIAQICRAAALEALREALEAGRELQVEARHFSLADIV